MISHKRCHRYANVRYRFERCEYEHMHKHGCDERDCVHGYKYGYAHDRERVPRAHLYRLPFLVQTLLVPLEYVGQADLASPLTRGQAQSTGRQG